MECVFNVNWEASYLMALSFSVRSFSSTITWWRPKLEVEAGCQITNIRCEVENIGVYNFNIFSIKSDELQFLKILSANKFDILYYVDLLYQICYIYYCNYSGDEGMHVFQPWSNWYTHMNPHTCFSDKWLSTAGNQQKRHFIIQQMHKYIIRI